MTAAEWLDRADALAAEATEGPWALFLAWDSTHGTNYGVDGPPIEDPWPVMRGGFEEDAAFIAAARTDWPRANAALRAVLALADEAEAQGRGFPEISEPRLSELRLAASIYFGMAERIRGTISDARGVVEP